MQTHVFGPYEFESPESEQTLRIAMAKRLEHRDTAEFERSCARESQYPCSPLPSPLPLEQFHRFVEVRAHVERFDCLPEPVDDLSVVAVLSDEWNDLDLLLESPSRRYWLHWDTTA